MDLFDKLLYEARKQAAQQLADEKKENIYKVMMKLIVDDIELIKDDLIKKEKEKDR